MSLQKFTIIILPMRLVYTIINSERGTSTSLFEEILVKLSIPKKSIKYGRSGDRKQEYFFYWPDHTITMVSQTSILQNCIHIHLKRNKKFQSLFIIFYLQHLKSSKLLVFFLAPSSFRIQGLTVTTNTVYTSLLGS